MLQILRYLTTLEQIADNHNFALFAAIHSVKHGLQLRISYFFHEREIKRPTGRSRGRRKFSVCIVRS